jgi:undecaprenyl diphosphate synthase
VTAVSSNVRLWEPLPPPVAADGLPRHVGIIMDGNGRWAEQQGFSRIRGHQAGVESVRDIISYCGQIGLQTLTLYALSTENWKRPKAEIECLMVLLERYLRSEVEELNANGVRLLPIGRLTDLPDGIQRLLQDAVTKMAGNRGLRLCVALSYGARDELVNAARQLCEKVERGAITPSEIDRDMVAAHLFTADLPPVDLMIRTAGERRLSNFLLWQASHAVFRVDAHCWPAFRREHLGAALEAYVAEKAR